MEPWEPTITTKADFSRKWESKLGQPGYGLFEGGGYQSKGVWRSSDDCRMNTNAAKDFCPVCSDAVRDMVRFYTGD